MGKIGVILKSIHTCKNHHPGYLNLPNLFYQMIFFPLLSDKSTPALVYLMLNAAFSDFLNILGFLGGEEWLGNPSGRDIAAGTCEGLGHPGMLLAARGCRQRRENHLFALQRGLLPPGALPPQPGSGPSCRVSMSTEGMNLLRLKILCFYLDEKKNLACLHWHTKIGSVWVNLQNFSWWIYLASLLFFKLII